MKFIETNGFITRLKAEIHYWRTNKNLYKDIGTTLCLVVALAFAVGVLTWICVVPHVWLMQVLTS